MDSIRRLGFAVGMAGEDLTNPATRVLSLFGLGSALRGRTADFRTLFLESFDLIRTAVTEAPDYGFVIFAAGGTEIEEGVWLRATPHTINAAVVGRHAGCHLHLARDCEASLRHAALILSRQSAHLRLRLVDLRTATGLIDEQGLAWRNLESDGPIVVRLASSSLMAFPTGPSVSAWPSDAEEAWRAIPPRAYSDSSSDVMGARSRSWRVSEDSDAEADAEAARGTTLVRGLPPPVAWSRSLLAEGESARGELSVRSRQGEARLAVGPAALRRGVLLGRYDRCDNEGVPVLSDLHISRVHVLVIEVDGQVYAVDTGSKNGLWRGSERVRRCTLADGEVVDLGGGLAHVTWTSLH